MPLFDELDVFLDSTPRRAALNMAIDEALLESSTRPLLRFYRWDHPALSFGYFGKFEDVAEYAAKRDLVRRWTGGGIVFHGEDLTYALIVPASFRHLHKSSLFVYEAVHSALREVLIGQGRRAELATQKARVASPACFARPVVADVMVEDRKVAGAAQRRTRAGLLHQGSIQGIKLLDDLGSSLARALSRRCHYGEQEEKIVHRAREIADAKYATDAWLRRR